MSRTTRRVLAVLRSPVGILAVVACLALAFLAIFAPIIWGAAAAVTDTEQLSQPPSAEHVFGTDGSGRDILLRTLVATRLSVVMALTATLAGVVCGVVLGLLPLMLGGMIAGTVLVENIFAWPGLGSTIVSSIQGQDFPLVQAIILFYGAAVLLINLVVDVILIVVDPRTALDAA